MTTPSRRSSRTLRRDLAALAAALRPAARTTARAISRAYWFTLSAFLSIGVGFLIAFLFVAAVHGLSTLLPIIIGALTGAAP